MQPRGQLPPMLSNKRGSQPAKRPLETDEVVCKKSTAKIEWRIYFLTGRSLRLAPRIINVSTRYFGVEKRAARRSWQRRTDQQRGYGSPYRKGERERERVTPGERVHRLAPPRSLRLTLCQSPPLSGS